MECLRWATRICDISESEDDCDELVPALVARVSRVRNCWSNASRSLSALSALSVLVTGFELSKLAPD